MIKRALFTIFISLVVASCDRGPRLIEEDELQNIIRDMLITDVYVTNSDSIGVDSVEYFSPILDRYGYKIEDIDYTIRRYALRKSSVLGPMLDNISTEFDSLKRVYNYRGNMIKEWRESSKKWAKKVVFFMDSLQINSEKDRLVIELPVHYSGEYTITYLYRLDSTLKRRSFATSFSSRDTTLGKDRHRGRYWMSWGKDTKRLNSSTKVDAREYNMMEYNIPDKQKGSDKGKNMKIRIDSIKVTYLPTDGYVEQDYLNHMLKFSRYDSTMREKSRLFKSPLPMASEQAVDSLLHHIDSLTMMLKEKPTEVPFLDNNNNPK